jgi:hypothetical protein
VQLEELLELTQPQEFLQICQPLFATISACVTSPHFQVSRKNERERERERGRERERERERERVIRGCLLTTGVLACMCVCGWV